MGKVFKAASDPDEKQIFEETKNRIVNMIHDYLDLDKESYSFKDIYDLMLKIEEMRY